MLSWIPTRGGSVPATMTSASEALVLSTSTSASNVHFNGSGVKVTSTPPTVIVTWPSITITCAETRLSTV